MKFWQRMVVALFLAALYVVAVRPSRGMIVSSAYSFVDESALKTRGYQIASTSTVNRTFSGPAGAELLFKGPFDIFFQLSLIFSVVYGVPVKWLARITVLHIILWTVSWIALIFSSRSDLGLNVTDFISSYINPVLTLSLIPLWIFERNRLKSISQEAKIHG